MKTRLLSTVAASLLLTMGAASAQGMNERDHAPARAPAAQQSAPAEKLAPSMKTPETTGQATPQGTPDYKGSMDRNPMNKTQEPAGSGMKNSTDSTKPGADTMRNNAQDSTRPNSSTTGQGAGSGSKLSSDQQSKISSAIRRQKVERVEPSKLNISIKVGTRVPSSVRFHRLPAEVITLYPEWRGYDYIMVGDQIVILDPRTHEIVFIIAA